MGPDVEETLALVDFELKRLGVVAPLPLGVPVSAGASRPAAADSALSLARAALAAFRTHGGAVEAVDAFGDPDETDLQTGGSGYLLTRDPDTPAPSPAHLPALADLLAVSGQVSAALLGAQPAQAGPLTSLGGGPTAALARTQVLTAAARMPATAAVLDRLRGLEQLLGAGLADELAARAPEPLEADDVLYPGARVCFTGEVLTPSGRSLGRPQMEDLA